jgi:hypothetical protein
MDNRKVKKVFLYIIIIFFSLGIILLSDSLIIEEIKYNEKVINKNVQ